MALAYARDSCGDLSEIHRRLQEEDHESGGSDSLFKGISLQWKKAKKSPGNSQDDQQQEQTQLLGVASENSLYEFVQDNSVEDEEEWPMWEMTGEEAWIDSWGTEASPPINECERIFTVPEVYNELQKQQELKHDVNFILGTRKQSEDCNLFNCFAPWRQQQNPTDTFVHHPSLTNITDDQEQVEKPQLKTAMKRTSMAAQLYQGMPASMRQSFVPSMYKVLDFDSSEKNIAGGNGGEENRKKRVSIIGNDRNQIFSVGSNDETDSKTVRDNTISKRNRRIHFSELKRVLKMRKFTPEEAYDVWYQREDFDHFKAEMTLLIQENEANKEVAEDWLLDPVEVQRRRSSSQIEPLEGMDDDVTDNGTLERSESSTNRTKSRAWWHDYDHSRRGLERYASPGQARQILASYKRAVSKVLDEQRRQRLAGWFCSPGAKDPERIAELYHEYTAWSRDLALAAAASDADAVRTDFDDEKRKTREYYILKQVISSGYKVHKHMPQFMLPRCITHKGFLDESESLHLSDVESRTYLGGMMKMASSKFRSQTGGEKAREEMSNLQTNDLDGPVAPALAPILKASPKAGQNIGEVGKDVGTSPIIGEPKRKSMAAKAKNYPFQQ